MKALVALLAFVGLMSLAGLAAAQSPAGMTPDQIDHEWRVHVQQQQIALDQRLDQLATRKAINAHKVATYRLQFWLSIILTVVAVTFVIAAMVFAYLQFTLDRERGSGATSTVKISTEGVEISSSVIGLFVLVAAMVFFYLYIMQVYTIRVAG